MAGARDKLTQEQREWIVRMLAEFVRPTDICRGFQKRFGRSIAKSLVTYYSKNQQETIKHYREDLAKTIVERIPIASKFWRLQALAELYRTENHYRITRYTKGVDVRGKETQIPIYEKPIGELRAILHLAAQEMGDLREVVELNDTRTLDEFVALFEDGGALGEESPDPKASAAPNVSKEITH